MCRHSWRRHSADLRVCHVNQWDRQTDRHKQTDRGVGRLAGGCDVGDKTLAAAAASAAGGSAASNRLSVHQQLYYVQQLQLFSERDDDDDDAADVVVVLMFS